MKNRGRSSSWPLRPLYDTKSSSGAQAPGNSFPIQVAYVYPSVVTASVVVPTVFAPPFLGADLFPFVVTANAVVPATAVPPFVPASVSPSVVTAVSSVPTVSSPPFGADMSNILPWSYCYWASGTLFNALGLTNGASVTTWPDERATGNALITGNAPTFASAFAGLNSQPAVTFAGSNALHQTSVTSAMASTVVVFKQAATGTNRWHDSQFTSGGGRWVMGTFSNNWQLYFGGTAGQSVAGNTNANLGVWYQSGSSDYMRINESLIYAVGDYGTSTMTRMNIVADAGVTIAFIAEYNGDPRTDGNWTAFKALVNAQYGIAV